MILSIYIDTNAELIASGSESFYGLNRVLVKKKIRLQCNSDRSDVGFAFLSGLLGCRFCFPDSLGCSGLFWIVLGCSRLFWAVLGCSELFWSVLSCSGLFWVVLDRSGLFWAVLGCAGLF